MIKRVAVALLIWILLIGCFSEYAFAGEIRPETWVATDDLGRVLPTNKEAGDTKEKKYVGIFYFLFLNTSYAESILDFSRIYQYGGTEAVWEAATRDQGFRFWGEPYFGYYSNKDPWVYAKHAQLLTDAGVDFVFLDVTNATGNMENGFFATGWQTLMKTWSDIRLKGGRTPQVVFHCGDTASGMNLHLNWLWEMVYRDEKYKDLWFYWDGKPLVLGNPDGTPTELLENFTVRRSWAFNGFTEQDDGKLRWPWIAETPQLPGRDEYGNVEQVVVASGFHSNSSKGRSFHNGKNEMTGRYDFGYGLETSGEGLAFREQWEHALEIDPPLIMVTGWNEFTFGRWEDAGEGQTIAGGYRIVANDPQFRHNYVDAFTLEYSRDIEPIRGFFRDNYYYQMCYYIRLYKGVSDIDKGTGSVDVELNGDLSEFSKVGPEFCDDVGDVWSRNFPSVGSVFNYQNSSGRNDLDTAKVSKVGDYTYFYINCAEDIVLPESDEEKNWMNLYIDSDQYHYSGWEGYDYVLNRSRKDGRVSVEKFVNNSWEFKTVGEADYTLNGNTLVIKVKSSLVSLDKRDNFDFKWADNSTVTGEVMEFMDLGDSAPNSRFNFRYVKEGGKISVKLLPGASRYPNTDDNHTLWLILAAGALCVCSVAAAVIVFIKKRSRIKNLQTTL
ncbi:MAG: hypothetical protein IIW02_01460 [Clostridia bacterium]|nr:hypothetical protein [Clostridia bacterium]